MFLKHDIIAHAYTMTAEPLKILELHYPMNIPPGTNTRLSDLVYSNNIQVISEIFYGLPLESVE